MYMRISWGRIKPGMWDEYERRYAEVADAVGGPKPVSRWLVRDINDPNAGYSVSLWDNEADLMTYASDPETRRKVQDTFGDLFTGEYETRLCRVQQSS